MGQDQRGGLGTLMLGAGLGFAAWRALKAPEELQLKGQVALVTGGSRGLGLLMAKALAREGCKLIICARDGNELTRAQFELEALGASVLALPCDVSDKDRVQAMVAEAIAHFGRIDVLINNASVIQVGPLDSLTLRDFEQAMDVNFWGVVHTTLAVLPAMRRQGAGRIVNIDSIGGKVAVPHLLPYDAAKFATRGFSEGLRAELAGTGIHVTTVLPGLMRTGSPLSATFKGQHALEFLWFSAADSQPLTAMDPERAATRILKALKRGEAEITLTWQAKALGLVHDLAPGLTMGALGLANRMLPKAAGPSGGVAGKDLVLPRATDPLIHQLNRLGERTNQPGTRRPSAIW